MKKQLFEYAVLRHTDEGTEIEIVPTYKLEKSREILHDKILTANPEWNKYVEEIEILIRPF